MKKTYVDDSGNIQFNDCILEEVIEAKEFEKENTLTQIFKRLVEKDSSEQNLKKLSGIFIIEQYTRKKANANQWMDSFEKECERLHITEDEKKLKCSDTF